MMRCQRRLRALQAALGQDDADARAVLQLASCEASSRSRSSNLDGMGSQVAMTVELEVVSWTVKSSWHHPVYYFISDSPYNKYTGRRRNDFNVQFVHALGGAWPARGSAGADRGG